MCVYVSVCVSVGERDIMTSFRVIRYSYFVLFGVVCVDRRCASGGSSSGGALWVPYRKGDLECA